MFRNNPILKPSKLKRRRRKIFAVKSILIFLLLIVFILLLSRLSLISAIQITDIEISGDSSVSKDEIISLVKKETTGNYYMLFSKNSLFLYPRRTIGEKIINNFKKIEKAQIKSKGFNTIILSLVERKPDSLWCAGGDGGENHKSANLGKCYFLDKEGIVFSDAPDFSGNAFMRYYGLLGNDDPIGKVYMPNEKFKEITYFVSSLKRLGLVATKFIAGSESDYEIYLENGSKIIFDDRQPLEKTLDNLQSILSEIGLNKNSGTSSSINLNYVDLRFGNKVFYKTK